MTWATDNLLGASFRGIPFGVVAHEASFGKAVAVHEFPLRDRPYVEELGRTAREFEIEAFLVGADYLARRDRLVEALLEAGPGELVHPWYGTVRVHGRVVRIRESAGDGRVCRLALSFVETGVAVSPGSTKDSVGAVQAAASRLLDAAEEGFLEDLAGVTRPGVAVDGAAQGWERVSDELSDVDLRGPSSKVAAWRDRLEQLNSEVRSRLAKPEEFSASLRNLFGSMQDAVGDVPSQIDALLRLSASELARRALGLSGPLLAGGPDADAGDAALAGLVARSATAEAANVALDYPWATYDDALRVRQGIIEALEDLNALGGDAAYQRTQDLISELVDGLPAPDANLPRLDRVSLPRSRPAIVLAYGLYDSTAREQDIVTRNRVPNPAFLPTGVPLDVLVDVA